MSPRMTRWLGYAGRSFLASEYARAPTAHPRWDRYDPRSGGGGVCGGVWGEGGRKGLSPPSHMPCWAHRKRGRGHIGHGPLVRPSEVLSGVRASDVAAQSTSRFSFSSRSELGIGMHRSALVRSGPRNPFNDATVGLDRMQRWRDRLRKWLADSFGSDEARRFSDKCSVPYHLRR